jgi:hypothetical protein
MTFPRAHSKMYRFTYNDVPALGSTFTTVVNFCSHTAEDLELQVIGHQKKYGVIHSELIDQEDLTFEDLTDD